MRTLFTVLSLIISTSVFVGCQNKNTDTSKPEWQQLFNGKDLDDWIPKIRKHEVGVNYQNTFSVKDGKMVVNYDGYEDFDQQYGHIFYKEPFRSEEHTSELQSRGHLVCRLLLEKKNQISLYIYVYIMI